MRRPRNALDATSRTAQGKRSDAQGKEAQESAGGQGVGDGPRRLRHDLRQDRRRDGLQRALYDGLRRLGLARPARRRPRQLYRDGRARRPDLPGHIDPGHLRRGYGLRRPAQRGAHGAGLRARRRRGHPARGPGVPQEMRAHAGPARRAHRADGAQDRGGGGVARLARLPDRRPHGRAHQPRPRRGAAARRSLRQGRRRHPVHREPRERGGDGAHRPHFDLPLIANMVEGGRTPVLPKKRLEELGYRMAIFPAPDSSRWRKRWSGSTAC